MKAFEEYIEGAREVTLSNGNTVEIPPLTWGKELRLYNILTKVFSKLSVSTDAEGNPQFDESQVYAFMTAFANDVSEIASIIFNKDKKWVENNLTSKDMVEFIVPLSLHIFGKLNLGLTNAVTKLAEEAGETP
ncbi:hypothetical protein J7J18_06930 [bacterium]|nr:hypothetical protein [bacterium]